MSTKSTAVAKPTAKESGKGEHTLTELVSFIHASKEDETSVAKILGINSKRAAELYDWVDCECTSAQAIFNFAGSVTNLNELAFCFYQLGVIEAKNDEAQVPGANE